MVMNNVKKNKISFCIYFFLMSLFSIIFCHYIYLAGSRVPIMDYWEWIADYGPKFTDGTISFWDFIVNPDKSALSAQHISPGSMALQLWILYLCKFDVRILVILGTCIRIVTGWGISILFLKKNFESAKSKSYLYVVSIILYIIYINLNQWEIISQPFAFTLSLRLMLYFVSFLWADDFFAKIPSRNKKNNIINAVLLGSFCALQTILISAAYFVGYLFAIFLVGVLKYLLANRSDKEKYLLPMGILLIFFMGATALYVFLMNMSVVAQSGASVNFNVNILRIIIGVFVYIGTLFIHQSLVETIGYIPFLIVGCVVFAMICLIIFLYFKLKVYEKEAFSIMCIVYAGMIGITIAFGRVDLFGVATMTSSRYVTESTVGLIGFVIVLYEIFNSVKFKADTLLKYGISAIIVTGILYSMTIELKMAPYRGEYNKQMYTYMLKLDETKDEDLTIFQNNAENVRYVTDFFKENEYSIFSKGFIYK